MDERGGHDQVVARDIEIELLHQSNRIEILLRDERDRDVVDVQFVLLDEVQKQIERTLEPFESDRECVDAGFEIGLWIHQPAKRARSQNTNTEVTDTNGGHGLP